MARTRVLTPAIAHRGTSGRIVAIDIARGFAIGWVVLYHLWSDLRYPNVYPAQGEAFRAVPHRFTEGNLSGGLTAISDAFFRVGYLGVPLFMLLSGLSLTIAALRRDAEDEEAPTTFVYRRLRRVLIPYWAGFAITLAFAAALAFVQWQRHGGAGYVDFLQRGDINVDRNQLIAGALLLPRIFRDEWQFAPEGSLWFVLLIVQYYLLFPVLLAAMKRLGPWMFLAMTLGTTLASLGAMTIAAGDLVEHRSWIEMGAPFRLFEFGAGMTIGFLIVRQPQMLPGVTGPLAGCASVAIGAGVFVAACLIAPDARLAVVQGPAIVVGLVLMFVPLLAKAPGRVEGSVPGRALAWMGVISYTVLIVSEPLRSVTHTMSAEGVADGWILLWAVAGFVPLTLLAARPLARVLGLVERDDRRLNVADLVGRAADSREATAELVPVVAPPRFE